MSLTAEKTLTYSVDVSFRCRRLTQEDGQKFWEYADHFSALPGKHKDGDATAYRWQTSLSGPRVSTVLAEALSVVRELSRDEDAEFLHIEIDLVE